MKMWKRVCAGLLVAALLPISSLAAETLDLKGIGRMTVPKNVTFEKGAQDALPFLRISAMAGRYRISSGCLIFSASER